MALAKNGNEGGPAGKTIFLLLAGIAIGALLATVVEVPTRVSQRLVRSSLLLIAWHATGMDCAAATAHALAPEPTLP